MSQPHTIESLLDGVVTLPSLPSTVSHVQRLVNSPQSSLSQVAHAIQADPAISIKTLRLVNSAFYGLPNKITSVDHAVSMLGMKVVKNLVLTASVFESFQKTASELLRHSVCCAAMMQIMVEDYGKRLSIDPDEAFVYGLLHDVGKLVFDEFLQQEAESVMLMARARKMPLHQAEKEVIGVDHAEVGFRLAQQWGLSELLAESIGAHHDLARTSNPEAKKVAAMLGVSNYICYASGIPSMAKTVTTVSDDAWRATEIGAGSFPRLLDRFFSSLGSVDELMEMVQ